MRCCRSAHVSSACRTPNTLCFLPFSMLMTPVYFINSIHTQSSLWCHVICHSCISLSPLCSLGFVACARSGWSCGQEEQSGGSSSLSLAQHSCANLQASHCRSYNQRQNRQAILLSLLDSLFYLSSLLHVRKADFHTPLCQSLIIEHHNLILLVWDLMLAVQINYDAQDVLHMSMIKTNVVNYTRHHQLN